MSVSAASGMGHGQGCFELVGLEHEYVHGLKVEKEEELVVVEELTGCN